jgi:hypothetical protein
MYDNWRSLGRMANQIPAKVGVKEISSPRIAKLRRNANLLPGTEDGSFYYGVNFQLTCDLRQGLDGMLNHRQHRGAWNEGGASFRDLVGPYHHYHHPPGRYRQHSHADEG